MLITTSSKLALPVVPGIVQKLDLRIKSGPFSDECVIDAKNDLDAVLQWLEQYKGKKTTHSTYKREAIRFLLWCSCECGKSLTALKVSDLEKYLKFLQAIPKTWCAPRGGKNTINNRPFVGPLSVTAFQCSVRVINSLLNYLVNADYLRTNPLKLIRTSQAFNLTNEERKYQVWARMLEDDEWKAILDVLVNMSENTKDAIDLKLRTQFLFAMLYLLGLRISEVAGHSWNAFCLKDGRWWFFVKGKGDKPGHIPVNDKLLEYVKAYRVHLGKDELPSAHETDRLIISIKTGKAYQLRILYNMVKDVGLAAAKKFPGDKQKSEKLKKFSPHWLRHLAASHQDKAGLSMTMIQENMRHFSANTTKIYMHAEDKARHDALQNIEFNNVTLIKTIPGETTNLLTIKIIKSNGINCTKSLVKFIEAIESNILKKLKYKPNKKLDEILVEGEKALLLGLAYELRYRILDVENVNCTELCKQIKREAEIRLLNTVVSI